MANLNFKGRPKGSGKSTFIEDPLLGDYKIVVDEYSYNVVDTTKEKTIGFYTNLGTAVLAIAKQQTNQDRIFSLKEYAQEFETIHTNLKEAILR
jgi:predicted kinase